MSHTVGPWGAAHQEPSTHQGALWSMILGIASVMCLCFPFGIAALITGLVATSTMNKAPGQYSGRAFAIVGIVMGIVGTIVSILYIGFTVYLEFGGGNEQITVWFDSLERE